MDLSSGFDKRHKLLEYLLAPLVSICSDVAATHCMTIFRDRIKHNIETSVKL